MASSPSWSGQSQNFSTPQHSATGEQGGLRIFRGTDTVIASDVSESVGYTGSTSGWEPYFAALIKAQGLVKQGGSQQLGSRAYSATIRRREVARLLDLLKALNAISDDPNIAIHTFPITESLNGLLADLIDAPEEGNTRAILRRVRNSIMDGGWENYKKQEARECVARILDFLRRTETVAPADVSRFTKEMKQNGLQPNGMPIFEYEMGAKTGDGEEENGD